MHLKLILAAVLMAGAAAANAGGTAAVGAAPAGAATEEGTALLTLKAGPFGEYRDDVEVEMDGTSGANAAVAPERNTPDLTAADVPLPDDPPADGEAPAQRGFQGAALLAAVGGYCGLVLYGPIGALLCALGMLWLCFAAE